MGAKRGRRRKSGRLTALAMSLLGLVCALVLSVVFYGAMVYQFPEETRGDEGERAFFPSEWPKAEESAGAPFPGALLALDAGTLEDERTEEVRAGGKRCLVVTRRYALPGGGTAEAVSAAPATYLEKLSEERFAPRLITGFTLAGLDAVCETREGEALLAARDGENVYLLRAAADEQELYALGVGARLEAP